MIKCKVCGKDFISLSSHLGAKHQLSKKQYLDVYPGSEIVSLELSAKFSQNSANIHRVAKETNYEKYIDIRKNICKKMRKVKGDNYTHSVETIAKMKESATKRPPRIPHTQETKEKISKKKIGKPVNLSEESKRIKTEKQKRQWAKRKQNQEEFELYISKLSNRRIEYIKENGVNLPKKGKITNIEKRFIDYLTQHSIKFEYQYFLEGKYYDFYLPDKNLLVEVDGEYWHRFPQAIKNDLEKHAIAKIKNYQLLRLTELQWVPELIFENNYKNIIEHNYSIVKKRIIECQNYEISISLI